METTDILASTNTTTTTSSNYEKTTTIAIVGNNNNNSNSWQQNLSLRKPTFQNTQKNHMTYKMLLTYFCVVVLVVVICKYKWNVTPPLRLTSIGIGCHCWSVYNFDSNQPTTWVNFEHNHPNRVQWTPSPPSQQPTWIRHGWMIGQVAPSHVVLIDLYEA